MLKIRLQGTTKDLKWFLKMLARDKRFVANKPSEPMDIKGSNKYKRVYTEIFRSEEDCRRYNESLHPVKQNLYVGSGTVFGVYPNRRNKGKK